MPTRTRFEQLEFGVEFYHVLAVPCWVMAILACVLGLLTLLDILMFFFVVLVKV